MTSGSQMWSMTYEYKGKYSVSAFANAVSLVKTNHCLIRYLYEKEGTF